MSMLNSELIRSGSASKNIRSNQHSRVPTANTTSSKQGGHQQKIIKVQRNHIMHPYQKMNSAETMLAPNTYTFGVAPSSLTPQRPPMSRQISQQVDPNDYYRQMKEQQILFFQTQQINSMASINGGQYLNDGANLQSSPSEVLSNNFKRNGSQKQLTFEIDNKANNYQSMRPTVKSRGGLLLVQKTKGQLSRLEEENDQQEEDLEISRKRKGQAGTQKSTKPPMHNRSPTNDSVLDNIQYLHIPDQSPHLSVNNDEDSVDREEVGGQEQIQQRHHFINPHDGSLYFSNEDPIYESQDQYYHKNITQSKTNSSGGAEYQYQDLSQRAQLAIRNSKMQNHMKIPSGDCSSQEASQIMFFQQRNSRGVIASPDTMFQQIASRGGNYGAGAGQDIEIRSRLESTNESFNNESEFLAAVGQNQIRMSQGRNSGQPNFQKSIIKDKGDVFIIKNSESSPQRTDQQSNEKNNLSNVERQDSALGSPQIHPSKILSPAQLNNSNEKYQGNAAVKTVRNQLIPPFQIKEELTPVKPVLPILEWKYIEQPSLTRLQTLIYHVHKRIILDLDLTIPGRPGLIRQQLVTKSQLEDFYSTKIKQFNTTRILEIQEPYDNMFSDDLYDTTECAEVDKMLLANNRRTLQYEKQEMKEFQEGPPIYIKTARSPQLFFNSRFESGNLREVEQVTEVDYNLYLNFDFSTTNYTQWYFFSVRNIKKGFQYTFNIMNLQKEESSYQQGMMPFVYSTKRNREKGTNDWTRGGENIEYFKGNLKTKNRQCPPDFEYDPDNLPFNHYYDQTEPPLTHLSQLTFNFSFDYDEDIVFFSQFQPYTLTDMEDYLFTLKKKYPNDHMNNVLKIQKLCDTLEGNPCHVLTISDNVNLEAQQLAGQNGQNPKQVVFLSSRVHPGESNSSFMIQGTIDFLLQQSKEAAYMREQFIFKIIPMLNPDGVVRGSYRCDSLGVDLNRRWNKPSKVLHPTIYFAKHILKQYMENQVIVFCDMHGHSRKRNVFMYGCQTPQTDIYNHKNNNLIKMIPYMLSQKNKDFQFNDSKFANEKEKESTARLVMFNEFNILNSYTLEATFYAPYDKDKFKKKFNLDIEGHIKSEDLVQVGQDFLHTIYLIMQSKIMRRKFLQLEGPGGQILTAPIIGGGTGAKASKDQPEKAAEKLKMQAEAMNMITTQEIQENQIGQKTASNMKPPLPQQQQQQFQTYLANPALNGGLTATGNTVNSSAFYCAQHQMQFPFGQQNPKLQNQHSNQYPNNNSILPMTGTIMSKIGATSFGSTSTATFLNNQSSSQLINTGGQMYYTNSFTPDYSHYGTSEFQRLPIQGQMINGIGLRKRSQRTVGENNTDDEDEGSNAVAGMAITGVSHDNTPQRTHHKSLKVGGAPNNQMHIMMENEVSPEIMMIHGNNQQMHPSMSNVTSMAQLQQYRNQIKMKHVVKIQANYNATQTMGGSVFQPSSQQQQPAQTVFGLPSPCKIQLKSNVIKSSLIQPPPQQINTILPEQILQLGKAVQYQQSQKNNTSLDFFKMYHNNKFGMTRNIRGLLNQNIIQATTSINPNNSPSPNHNMRSSNIHIIQNASANGGMQGSAGPPNNYTGSPSAVMNGNIIIQQMQMGGSPSKGMKQQQLSNREKGRQIIINQQILPLSSLFGGSLSRGVVGGSPQMMGCGGTNQGMLLNCQDQFSSGQSQVVSIQVPHDIERLPQIIQKQFLKKLQPPEPVVSDKNIKN